MSDLSQSYRGVDLTDELAARSEHGYAAPDRNEAIKAIRSALKRRSGKTWSVTGGRGTGWGWITIDAPPKRRTGIHVEDGVDQYGCTKYKLVDSGRPQEFGYMTPEDNALLCELLNLESVHHQGVMIPAGSDYRVEYVNRAEGRNPSTYGVPYWD